MAIMFILILHANETEKSSSTFEMLLAYLTLDSPTQGKHHLRSVLVFLWRPQTFSVQLQGKKTTQHESYEGMVVKKYYF